MHMAVEAGDGGEPAQITQCLRGVVGAPTPLRVHREQRDVAEHDDGSVAGQAGDVLFDELQLVGAQVPELAQIQRVDQRDQVHTGHVEAVPAVTGRTRPEDAAVLLPRVVDRIVLAGHGEHVRGLQRAHHLLGLVELLGRGQVGEIAGVDDEIRGVAQVVDLVDGPAEGARHVGVGGAGETEVAVADLGEPQGGLSAGVLCGRPAGDVGDHLAPGHGEPHRRPEPRRVPDQLPAAHVRIHPVTTTVPRIIG
ncbi:hypothetical protein MOKP126_12920 [Mycobacterium avium subsp. hominissuis]